jgi:hypothetical protein
MFFIFLRIKMMVNSLSQVKEEDPFRFRLVTQWIQSPCFRHTVSWVRTPPSLKILYFSQIDTIWEGKKIELKNCILFCIHSEREGFEPSVWGCHTTH